MVRSSVGDGDSMGIKRGNTTCVAKLAHGDEGAGGEVGENVDGTCCKGDIWEIKFGCVA